MTATSPRTRQTTATVHDAGRRPLIVRLDPRRGQLIIWAKGTRTKRHVDLTKLYWHLIKYPETLTP